MKCLHFSAAPGERKVFLISSSVREKLCELPGNAELYLMGMKVTASTAYSILAAESLQGVCYTD
jgi:hypothetical protein